MANFQVYLTPLTPDGIETVISIPHAKLGYNQLGWLMFEDVETREPVACFMPMGVRYAISDAADQDNIIIIEAALENEELVN